jgi:hypothetical protein
MSQQSPIKEPPSEDNSDSGSSSSGPIFWGILAVVGGGLLIAGQFMDLDAILPWVVPAIGLAMLLWGIFAHSAGGIIPGLIVTGVGAGIMLVGSERIDSSDAGAGYFLLCLALGFLAIPILTQLFTDEKHWWAFIPGSIIALVGLALILGGPFFQALTLLQLGGALALIGLGVWLIYTYAMRDQS